MALRHPEFISEFPFWLLLEILKRVQHDMMSKEPLCLKLYHVSLNNHSIKTNKLKTAPNYLGLSLKSALPKVKPWDACLPAGRNF